MKNRLSIFDNNVDSNMPPTMPVYIRKSLEDGHAHFSYFAPAARRMAATAGWSVAKLDGVRPSVFLAFTSAPAATRALTQSTSPLKEANMRAVLSFLALVLTSAPAATRASMQFLSPRLDVLGHDDVTEDIEQIC